MIIHINIACVSFMSEILHLCGTDLHELFYNLTIFRDCKTKGTTYQILHFSNIKITDIKLFFNIVIIYIYNIIHVIVVLEILETMSITCVSPFEKTLSTNDHKWKYRVC